MSNMKDSLNFGESISINGNRLTLQHTSGRMIGEVTMNTYDKSGKLLFSETSTNDVVLPGSIFVLEQMFKCVSSEGSYRFLHPNKFPVKFDSSEIIEAPDWNAQPGIGTDMSKYISDEYVFGFMVGQGGENASSILAPTYESSSLQDGTGTSTFIPFRITKTIIDSTAIIGEDDKNPNDDGVDYYIKINNGDKDYYFAKGFTISPKIYTKWADGSGDVTSDDLNYNVPILTYAEMTLDIGEQDIRDFFPAANSDSCYINQLGLVAGKPKFINDLQGRLYKRNNGYTTVGPTEATKSEYEYDGNRAVTYRKDFTDVKLITTLNFKSKDLSNDENKIKFIYKIYCL